MALTSKDRRYLKGLAHALEPVVRVGQRGVTPAVVAEANRSLEAHELIKVRIDADDPGSRRTVAEALAAAAEAEIAGMIGKLAILYRPRAEKPRIKLSGC
jgi:RNA-binding protein